MRLPFVVVLRNFPAEVTKNVSIRDAVHRTGTAPLLRRKNAIMALEPPDQQHWQAAVGYFELGMFADADSELDKIDPFCRLSPKFSL